MLIQTFFVGDMRYESKCRYKLFLKNMSLQEEIRLVLFVLPLSFLICVDSSPDFGITEPALLQHFRDGPGPESAIFLNSSSGGSFTHLTLSECKDILTKILQNTPYTGVYDEFPNEEEITQEEHMPNTLGTETHRGETQ
jgi:hypothetical protein